jgi:hypothetical protein
VRGGVLPGAVYKDDFKIRLSGSAVVRQAASDFGAVPAGAT